MNYKLLSLFLLTCFSRSVESMLKNFGQKWDYEEVVSDMKDRSLSDWENSNRIVPQDQVRSLRVKCVVCPNIITIIYRQGECATPCSFPCRECGASNPPLKCAPYMDMNGPWYNTDSRIISEKKDKKDKKEKKSKKEKKNK